MVGVVPPKQLSPLHEKNVSLDQVPTAAFVVLGGKFCD
jgi:hypothetical protein